MINLARPRQLRHAMIVALAITLLSSVMALGHVLRAPRSQAAVDTQAYIRTHYLWAQENQRTYGVPASVTLAQSILESGWGQSTLTVNAHNYFGIKCGTVVSPHQDGCYTINTQEYLNGQWVTISAQFRKYSTPLNSFLDHGRFLRNNSRYAAAFKYPNDADAFIYEVWKAGYATDPGYPAKISDLMKRYDLYQFNGLGSMPSAMPSVVIATATPHATPSGEAPTSTPTAPATPQQDPQVASVADQVNLPALISGNAPAPLPRLAASRGEVRPVQPSTPTAQPTQSASVQTAQPTQTASTMTPASFPAPSPSVASTPTPMPTRPGLASTGDPRSTD